MSRSTNHAYNVCVCGQPEIIIAVEQRGKLKGHNRQLLHCVGVKLTILCLNSNNVTPPFVYHHHSPCLYRVSHDATMDTIHDLRNNQRNCEVYLLVLIHPVYDSIYTDMLHCYNKLINPISFIRFYIIKKTNLYIIMSTQIMNRRPTNIRIGYDRGWLFNLGNILTRLYTNICVYNGMHLDITVYHEAVYRYINYFKTKNCGPVSHFS